jgi:multidrug efflux system membrane fusion protein
MSGYRRITRAGLAALGCALLLSLNSCSRGDAKADSKPDIVSVRTVTAGVSDVPLEIAAIGNVEANSSVDVKSRVTAPVLRVHFAEGSDIVKGQLLFDLDPETYNRQIAEIEANIAKDAANEKEAEANIVKDDATLKNARGIADRAKQLAREGIFSREQTDQMVSNADVANASLDADRAALESAKTATRADRARLEQTKLLLAWTQIHAPIAGRAGAIAVKEGNLAKENDTTLVTILQTSPVYVSFSVPEDLLPEIRRYQKEGSLAVKAIAPDKRESAGTLSFIDNLVDTSTGTIRLKAIFSNPDGALWPGQFVNVRARLSVERERVTVPSRTVQTGTQGKYVWVVNPADASVAMRNVEVPRVYTPEGVAPGDQAELAVIASGLKPGEQVVSEGQMRLSATSHIRLLGNR